MEVCVVLMEERWEENHKSSRSSKPFLIENYIINHTTDSARFLCEKGGGQGGSTQSETVVISKWRTLVEYIAITWEPAIFSSKLEWLLALSTDVLMSHELKQILLAGK
jgi:hypothetical protein